MDEIVSNVSLSKKGTSTLKVIIPKTIHQALKIDENSQILWELKVIDSEMAAVIRKK